MASLTKTALTALGVLCAGFAAGAGAQTPAPEANDPAALRSDVAHLKDINPRETLMLSAFAAAVLLFGVWPAPLTHLMDASIRQIVDHLLVVKAI